jgi:hypothetical protein
MIAWVKQTGPLTHGIAAVDSSRDENVSDEPDPEKDRDSAEHAHQPAPPSHLVTSYCLDARCP